MRRGILQRRNHLVLNGADFLAASAFQHFWKSLSTNMASANDWFIGKLELDGKFRPGIAVPAVLRHLTPHNQILVLLGACPAEHRFCSLEASGPQHGRQMFFEGRIDLRWLHWDALKVIVGWQLTLPSARDPK